MKGVTHGNGRFQSLSQGFGVEERGELDTSSGQLVFVTGADTPSGCSDGKRASEGFSKTVGQAVVGENHVGVFAEEEPSLQRETALLQLLFLPEEGLGVDDDPPVDHAGHIGMEDSGGDEVENQLTAGEEDRVPGVVASLVADGNLEILGKKVDDFPFPFVSPLKADNGVVGGHSLPPLQGSGCPRAQGHSPRAIVKKPGEKSKSSMAKSLKRETL